MVSLSELSTELELRDTDTILVSVVLSVPEVLPLVAETFTSTVALFAGGAGGAAAGPWVDGLTAAPAIEVDVVVVLLVEDCCDRFADNVVSTTS